MVSDLTVVSKPANPTHPANWTQLRYQKWNGEEWQTVGAVPSTWYDCSTWADYYQLNGQQYWGYKESVKGSGGGGTKKTVTVLAQSGSTAVQNFAFEGMEDI